jgi:RNA polymerase sigma factor (sigma-70 family)
MVRSDLDLLTHYVKTRDAQAFAELVARHRDMVYATCRRLVGNRADAEDVAQECFVQLARGGAGVRTSVAGWLHRVATRSALAQRRKDRARQRAEREAGSMAPERDAVPTWDEIKAEVDRAIDTLPDDLREPLVLHFLQAKPQTAVAEELGLTQSAVSKRLAKAVDRLRRHLGPAGAALSVAGLMALLKTHSSEAAPATLIADLGRMALAGIPPAPAASPLGSLLGPAASMGPGSKVLCLLVVALTIGGIVQQVTQVAPSAHPRSLVQEAAPVPAASPEVSPTTRGPSGSSKRPATARPGNGESQPEGTRGEPPRPSADAEPGRASQAARSSVTRPGAATRGAGSGAPPLPAPHAGQRSLPVGHPLGGHRVAQADAAEPIAPQRGADAPASARPAEGAAEHGVQGASVYLSPTGWVSITDEKGLLATLWLMVFGDGWIPEDQRRPLTGFPVPDAAGWLSFAGELPVFGTNGGRALYSQRSRRTDTGVEIEYGVTFNQTMRIDGVTLAMRIPYGRFANDAVALRIGDEEVAVITLPEEFHGYRLGSVEAERLDVSPYPNPLFSVAVVEPNAVPLPLRVPFAVQDLRLYDLDEFEVQIGGLMAAGQEVSPDTNWSLKLSLEFAGALPLGVVEPPQITLRRGVTLCRDARVDGAFCEHVADVVSAAKQAYEELFPDLAKEEIRVCALPATSWRDNLATNRRDTIYLRVRDDEFGEAMRADAGPVGMLCQAVAELYNPGRFPGLDRFMTHRHLVPAVTGRLGAGIFPGRHATPVAVDGPEMLAALTGEAYAPVHPDFAAAKALGAIEDALGWDGFRSLPGELPANIEPDLEGLRWAATAQDPQLAAAFAAYDEATGLEFGDDGTHLIASFEPDETAKTVSAHPLRSTAEDVVLVASPELEVSPSDEWATDGARSLRLHADRPQPGMYVAIADPDWQLKDWRRFARFEMDLMVRTERPEQPRILVMDDVGGAHGRARLLHPLLSPGDTTHLSCDLTPWLPGQESHPQSECIGPFRPDEIALLCIDFPHPTGQPVTLYIDNLRLKVRSTE